MKTIKLIISLMIFLAGCIYASIGIYEVDYSLMISGLILCFVATVYARLIDVEGDR